MGERQIRRVSCKKVIFELSFTISQERQHVEVRRTGIPGIGDDQWKYIELDDGA